MKHGVALLLQLVACMGCTTLALERHTLSQGDSAQDVRYQEVLDNLAMVARDPYALPAYSSIFAGSAQITDTAQLSSTTTMGPGAAAQILNPQYTRAVLGNWALDPLNAPEKLEAIRCACRWVLYGPDFACHDCIGLLETPEQAPYPGRHFGVANRLARLPQGWLRKGRLCEAPVTARYKAHCGDTCVWVMPKDVKGLTDFSLILQDIARVDINSPTLQYIREPPSDFVFPTTARVDPVCQSSPIAYTGSGILAEVSVNRCGYLVPDVPYYRWRVENLGSDPSLRSQISAAAAGLH
jgi:hypothetical protein